MPKLKANHIFVTNEEDAAITAASMSHPDATQLTDAELAAVKPLKRLGRPPSAEKKDRITIRLSQDVVQTFRATGGGWQKRLNDALKDWLKTNSPV